MPTNHERAAALTESLRGMHTTSPTALKRIVAALDAAQAEGHWQPIETFPTESRDMFWFWVVPKTADESPVNTSGEPIVVRFKPYLHRGKYKSWGALSKPTHWQREPAPPETGDTTT